MTPDLMKESEASMRVPKRRKVKDNSSSISNEAHDQVCSLHGDAYHTMTSCNGKKIDGRRCTRSARDPQTGDLPTCKQHRNQKLIEGHCQAIATCGHKCLRSFVWMPPYFQVCPKHADYAMPCRFLSLPPELLSMIVECLLPTGEIPVSGPPKSWQMLLRVNKQLSEEVHRLLYGHIPYTILIDPEYIIYAGKSWLTSDYHRPRFPGPYDFSKVKCFHCKISFPGFPQSISRQDDEDAGLFKIRDNLWKFVEYLKRLPRIQNLQVSICFGWPDWEMDEFAAASKFLLYPFKALRRIQVPRIAGIFASVLPWDQQIVLSNFGLVLGASRQDCENTEAVLGLFASSEGRVRISEQLIAEHEGFAKYEQRWTHLLSGDEQVSLTYGNYQSYIEVEEFAIDLIAANICGPGIRRGAGLYHDPHLNQLLHRARLAQETQDLEALQTIRRRLVRIYKSYRAQLSNHFTAKFRRMLGHITDWTTPIAPQSIGVLPPQIETQNWPDPPPEQIIPNSTSEGVTWWTDEDGIEYIKTAARTYIRYRTPAVVRQQSGRA